MLTDIFSFPHVGPRVELKWSGLRPPLLPVCPPPPPRPGKEHLLSSPRRSPRTSSMEPESKEARMTLRNLKPGDFWVPELFDGRLWVDNH